MSIDLDVQLALETAGDLTGATVWRRVCRDLGGPVRIALLTRDDNTASIVRAGSPAVEAEWVDVPIDDDDAGLGTEDRLLACHAAIAATPYARALGSRERSRLSELASTTPSERRLFVVGRPMLERLSDRPEEEAEEVLQRARSVRPDGWEVSDEGELLRWVEAVVARRRELGKQRRGEVATLLLHGAQVAVSHRMAQAVARRDEVSVLLLAEDAALDQAAARGRRTAAHILSAVRRQTEQLLVDLRDFLLRLEADIPAQAEAIEAVGVLRRTLPHWLHHVVEGWLADRLAQWRTDLAADLVAVGLTDEDAALAELVVPAMAPGPVTGDGSWTSRLGATAAVGGGAALLVAGMWFPALLAVTGGLAWSALGSAATQADTRRRVLEAAVAALRTMSGDAASLLQEQISHVEGRLSTLEANAVEGHKQQRATIRASLQHRIDDAEVQVAACQSTAAALKQATDTLRGTP